MSATVNIRHVQGLIVLEVGGRITLGEGGVVLRDAIQNALQTGAKAVVLDLGEVSYMDSSGLGELTGAYVSAQNKGAVLKLVNLTRKIDDLMQITKLATIFDMYATQEDAIAAVGK